MGEREGRKYAKKKRRRRRSEDRERQWRMFLLIPSKAKPSPTTSRPSAEARRGLFFDHVQGFALGTGSAIAHEAIHGAVRSFSGDGGQGHAAPAPQQQQAGTGAAEACGARQKAFLDCMAANNG